MNTVVERVQVASGLLDAIKTHARREAFRNCEAVGFLAQRKGEDLVSARMPLNNHAPDPQRTYFVEPWEQYRAEILLKRRGYVIVGVYHSHPNGEALPSQMDSVMARPGELMVIYSVPFDTISAWRETDGDLVPVELV